MANNIVVRDANGSSVTMKTNEVGGVHAATQLAETTKKRFRDGFEGSSLDAGTWTSVTGTGQTINVASGTMTMTSGTTASAEAYILSVDTFTVPMRLTVGILLSQRIANQSFLIELVSVDTTTLLPDGKNVAAWLFDGTTATQAKYRVQAQNGTILDSAASTVPTTATATVFDIEVYEDECWWHAVVQDSASGRSNSYRRHQKSPDPTATYKIRLRWLNGGTAPATSTTATVYYVAGHSFAELTAEVTAGRGNISAGQALGVAVLNTVSATASNSDNIFYNESSTAQAANATLTGTTRDVGIAAGSGHRYAYFRAFALADQAGTVRIECSNDNSTWRAMTANVAVAANTPTFVTVPVLTRYHRVVYVNGATLQTIFMLNSGYSTGGQ